MQLAKVLNKTTPLPPPAYNIQTNQCEYSPTRTEKTDNQISIAKRETNNEAEKATASHKQPAKNGTKQNICQYINKWVIVDLAGCRTYNTFATETKSV